MAVDGLGSVSDPAEPVSRRGELTRQGRVVTWWAEQAPDAGAIVSKHGDRTFAQLDHRADQVARALGQHGLRAGDSVALVCSNRPEFAEVLAACLRAGMRLTPVNWHLSAGEAEYIANDCGAKAVVAETSLGPAADGAASASGALVRIAIGEAGNGFEPYEVMIDETIPEAGYDAVPGSVMLYTSGTTGRPKGVERRAGAVSTTAVNIYGYSEDGSDVHLCTGPLYHAAPLAFSLSAPLAFGCEVVLMDGWDPVEALRLIEHHRVTHSHMVPTMFRRLLALPYETRNSYDTSSLRYVLHGAAPCPVELKRRVIEWLGPVVWEYYAATEGVGSFVDSPTWLAHPGTVGMPMSEGQVKVADESGEELPRGEVGLLWIRARGDQRFEYHNDPGKTAAVYRGDYFTLGDIGRLDADGYLYVTDRVADVIISGGVNVYPAEVEAVLLQHPSVADAAVIGVPDPEWSEHVLAVVEPESHVRPSEALAAELLAFTRQRLAHFKCPRRIEFTDGLPRQDNGKLYRRLLRDTHRQSVTPSASGGDHVQ